MPPNSETRSFVLWSGLKHSAFHHRGPVYLWSFLALSAAFLYFAHCAGMIAVACGFVCTALLEVGVSTLADVFDWRDWCAYEHVRVSIDNPQCSAAMAKLEADDQHRQNIDFALNDLSGTRWSLKDLRPQESTLRS